jgi:hypothetical protein
MNCANHQQTPAAAYCRTCGKPLCTNCTRPVMGVVYCENCLAEKVAGTVPAQASYQSTGQSVGITPPPSPGPNPGLAGILGAIPFGVGAVYCGQYTKGLVHLGIFVFLVVSLSSNLPGYLYPILGITMAFFIVYQIMDAVRTARAIQSGQPVPDPFGITTTFSPGERPDFSKGVPTGAVVLIGLGVLFLLHNLNIWFLEFDTLWPLLLIGLGVWLLAKRKACNDRSDYRYRSLSGPAVLITVGVLSLLDNVHDRWNGVPGWGHTWPLILLVIGVIKLMERSGHGPYTPMSGPPPGGDVLPQQPPPASEVNNEVKNG